MTLIGVPRESATGERRVALVPKVVERLHAAGFTVVVETGAGAGALMPDEQYVQAGATIGDPWPADLVVKVNPPTADEIGLLKPESTVIGFLAPRTHPEVAEGSAPGRGHRFRHWRRFRGSPARRRWTRCRRRPTSPGYKAVLLAASEATRFFPMLTTAAGTVKPATVLVLGVGVAGLQALATAKRLGGKTTGYDVRPGGGRPGPLGRCAVARPRASTPPVRAGTPASSPRRSGRSSSRRWRRRSPASTW